jgi:hypothetical protein
VEKRVKLWVSGRVGPRDYGFQREGFLLILALISEASAPLAMKNRRDFRPKEFSCGRMSMLTPDFHCSRPENMASREKGRCSLRHCASSSSTEITRTDECEHSIPARFRAIERATLVITRTQRLEQRGHMLVKCITK